MSNKKQNSIEFIVNLLIDKGYAGVLSEDEIEQAKAMHKEEVKSAYVSGYLDNGYYEGAEEDAAKLWEDTYGFVYNETFNNDAKK